MSEAFEFIKTKSVYTDWNDDELFISVERKSEKGDGEYDDLYVMAKWRGCKDSYELLMSTAVIDEVAKDVMVDVNGHPEPTILSEQQYYKIVEMVAAVNAEFERT